MDGCSAEAQSYITYLTNRQDLLLASTLQPGTYTKLYTYHYLINGFAAQMSPKQVERVKLPQISFQDPSLSAQVSFARPPLRFKASPRSSCGLSAFHSSLKPSEVSYSIRSWWLLFENVAHFPK